jgi:hypothetical protein
MTPRQPASLQSDHAATGASIVSARQSTTDSPDAESIRTSDAASGVLDSLRRSFRRRRDRLRGDQAATEAIDAPSWMTVAAIGLAALVAIVSVVRGATPPADAKGPSAAAPPPPTPGRQLPQRRYRFLENRLFDQRICTAVWDHAGARYAVGFDERMELYDRGGVFLQGFSAPTACYLAGQNVQWDQADTRIVVLSDSGDRRAHRPALAPHQGRRGRRHACRVR